MADKRFYWIKLKTDFFDVAAIDWLLEQEHGSDYVVLYLKLCLLTANSGGELSRKIGEMIIPYEPPKIAEITHFNVDTVRIAVGLYQRLGLIYEQENGMLAIASIGDMIGSETAWAQKKRAQRRQVGDNVPLLSPACGEDNVPLLSPPCEGDNVRQEIEIRDRDRDRDRDREKRGSAPARPIKQDYGELKNVKLTVDEHEKLISRYGVRQVAAKIDELSLYLASSGKAYKSHYATVLKWLKRDGAKEITAAGKDDGDWL